MFAYRLLWAVLMVTVVAPGFIFASSVEGIGFVESVHWVSYQLADQLWVPGSVANYLAYPVTVFAKLFPSSSTAAVLLGEMIMEGIGFMLTIGFFALVRPPFYVSHEIV